MNTNTRTNFTIGIAGFAAAAFFGVTLIETTGLETIGILAAYVTALAIFAVAGADNNRRKKLV